MTQTIGGYDNNNETSMVKLKNVTVTSAGTKTLLDVNVLGVSGGGTAKYAKSNVSASTTDGVLVAAVASKKIRVLAAVFIAGATATNVTFNTKPAGGGTAISALFAAAANGGACLAFSPVGWFETVAGEGLTVTTGAGATVGISLVYVEV